MSRLPFIDWVRGLAVVAMVLWHTVDAWLEPGLRDGQGWSFLRFFGGLAAPSFLFLAGVSSALAAKTSPDADVRKKNLRASLGRGFEVMLVGYLLRFQTWLIDAAAIRQLGAIRAYLPLGLGYGCLVLATKRLEKEPRKALALALGGLALCVTGFVQVESVARGRLPRLLQVDVLQAIGLSLVLLALLSHAFALLDKPKLLVALGCMVALATEPLGSCLPGPLPAALAGYLGKWPTAPGVPPAALFPLFPWFAYACFGAAAGALLRTHRAESDRVVLLLSCAGAAVALATGEAHHYMHDLFALVPWSAPLMRVAYRVGIVLTLFSVGLVWASASRGRVLLDYGRTSLRIYWAHMLFAYGVLGRLMQKKSSYGEWLIGATALLVAMWLLAQIGRPKAQRADPTALVPRPTDLPRDTAAQSAR